MNMGLKKRRASKVFIGFFISYIIILFIPITTGSIIYNRAISALTEQNAKYDNAMLLQLRDTLDGRIDQMNQIITEVSLNNAVKGFLYVSNPSNSFDRYNAVQLIKDLAAYKNVSNSIDDFYVYFSASDVILTPDGKYDPEMFYRVGYCYQNLGPDYWYDNVLKKRFVKSDFIYPTMQSSSNSDRKYLTYIRTVPLDNSSGNYANIVQLISVQKLQQMLKEIAETSKSDLYIIDDNNRIVVSNDNSELSLDVLNDVKSDNGIFYKTINNKEVAFSYIASRQIGWRYVVAIPSDVYLAPVQDIKYMTVVIIAICLVLGIIIAYFMAYRDYNPIKKIIQQLMVHADKNNIANIRDEYDFIERTAISSIINEQQMRHQLDARMPILRSEFLKRLLVGKDVNYDVIKDSLEFYNLHFDDNKFLVCIIHIDDYSKFAISSELEKELALAKFIITNIAEEVLAPYGKCYIMESDERTIDVIINMKDAVLDEIIAELKKVQGIIQGEFSILFSAYIGGIVYNIKEIKNSYAQAVTVMNYKIAMGYGVIADYSQIEERNKKEYYYYPLEVESKLINYVKAGDAQKALALLDETLKENFQKRKLPYELLQCLFFDIMSTGIKIMNEIGLEQLPMESLCKCDTVEQMHQELKGIFTKICEHINANKKSHNEELREIILDLVGKDYRNNKLGLSYLANKIGISEAYLSHFFKEQTGINLSDYINQVRLKHAKEILKQGCTLSETAQNVGYTNDLALIRAFKKYEGITPGKFKDTMSDNP
ncbi:transcriptional regulator, AraC family [Mahella australiensis 50-1 BON]|uniref:Transcriptional regulator, AraC family n=2 Tax=Mahella TaxID=252965 RepID=F3ZZP0_MAHA5|nr:transcriptional regulator, AraC family [Mahella australiensis 50-1 BON]